MDNNYHYNQVDEVTGQSRVTPRHHFVAEFYKDEPIGAGQNLIKYLDVQADREQTLFVKTTKNTQIDISYAYETADNPDTLTWFTYCNSAGTAITPTCDNTNKAIPLSMKGITMKIVFTNTDSEAGALTAAVD